jgi:hypothetical protein
MSEIKKVFYTCYQPYLVDMARRLHKEKGWMPVYWFTEEVLWPEISKELKSEFPDTIFHHYNDAIKGKWPEQAKQIPILAADNELLEQMSKYESTIMALFDRNDLLGVFKYSERVTCYHDQLEYWNSVLEFLKPDLVVLEAIPHQVCDFLIYRLAKLKGIKTIMFNGTFFLDSISTMESYETGQDEVIAEYKQLLSKSETDTVLSAKTEEYLKKFLGKYEDNLRYDVKEGLDELSQIRSDFITRTSNAAALKAKSILNKNKWRKRIQLYKDRHKESVFSHHKRTDETFAESTLTNSEYQTHLAKANQYKKQLLAYYNVICEQKPDLSKPFIYCPLHLQPEATTNPLGGPFVNQILMIRMLSAAVPEGWTIYVKEHMAQFITWFLGEPIRSKEYYKRISLFKNVKLISLDIDSYTLIDHCRAAATVTGTICLEGALRGKPVLAFGHPIHYHKMEGVSEIRTNADLQNAMNKILSGYIPDLEKVKLYIEATHRKSFPGGVGTPYNNGFMGINRKMNTTGHYSAIESWLQRNQVK